MTENPYEPSSSGVECNEDARDKTIEASKTSIGKGILRGVILLAELAGLSFAVSSPAYSVFTYWLVILLPAIAILIVSGSSVASGDDGRMKSLSRQLLKVTQVLVVAVAGYVAFAVTCCGINVTQVRPHAYAPPPVFGGITTFACTLLGCWLAVLMHKAIRWIVPPKS